MVCPRKCRVIGEYLLVGYCIIMMLAVLSIKHDQIRMQSVKERDVSNDSRIENADEIIRKLSGDISSYQKLNITYNNETFRVGKTDFKPLEDIPDNFPLSNGLMRPIPYYKVGSVKPGATITIGVPSIKRIGKDYLIDSIRSLFDNLSTREMETTNIVVFLGDLNDEKYLLQRMDQLLQTFESEIQSRNLEIIVPPPTYYPEKWELVVKPLYGDDYTRAKWRSKQNLDQAFLMMYIYHLNPTYYLMMEDDIISAKNYYKNIIKAADDRVHVKWFYISFCSLGAIGKLFKTDVMPAYASFIHTFWNIKPLDWIQSDFAKSKICSYDENEEMCAKRLRVITPQYHPSLFQHVGKMSSLQGKTQGLIDSRFKENAKL